MKRIEPIAALDETGRELAERELREQIEQRAAERVCEAALRAKEGSF